MRRLARRTLGPILATTLGLAAALGPPAPLEGQDTARAAGGQLRPSPRPPLRRVLVLGYSAANALSVEAADSVRHQLARLLPPSEHVWVLPREEVVAALPPWPSSTQHSLSLSGYRNLGAAVRATVTLDVRAARVAQGLLVQAYVIRPTEPSELVARVPAADLPTAVERLALEIMARRPWAPREGQDAARAGGVRPPSSPLQPPRRVLVMGYNAANGLSSEAADSVRHQLVLRLQPSERVWVIPRDDVERVLVPSPPGPQDSLPLADYRRLGRGFHVAATLDVRATRAGQGLLVEAYVIPPQADAPPELVARVPAADLPTAAERLALELAARRPWAPREGQDTARAGGYAGPFRPGRFPPVRPERRVLVLGYHAGNGISVEAAEAVRRALAGLIPRTERRWVLERRHIEDALSSMVPGPFESMALSDVRMLGTQFQAWTILDVRAARTAEGVRLDAYLLRPRGMGPPTEPRESMPPLLARVAADDIPTAATLLAREIVDRRPWERPDPQAAPPPSDTQPAGRNAARGVPAGGGADADALAERPETSPGEV